MIDQTFYPNHGLPNHQAIGLREVGPGFDGPEFCIIEAMHVTSEARAKMQGYANLFCAAPDLLAACKTGIKLCRCRGKGSYQTSCTLCGDSTFDHECNDRTRLCDDSDCKAMCAAIAKAEGR